MKNKKIFFAGLAIVILAAALGMYFVYAGPGTVTNTWDFTAPANYEYDHAKVEVSGGKAQLRKAVHTQEDATFAGGTGTDAAVDADGVVQLVSGQASGTYTSRIFDAGESVTWEKLKAKVIYPHPIEPDCSDAVACWHFDESSWNGTTGEVIDATGVNNGTAKNGAHPTTVAISGNAGHFDGKNDYVDCGNDESLNITDAITIEAWVEFDKLRWVNSIVEKGHEGYNVLYMLWRGDNESHHRWGFEFGDSTVRDVVYSEGNISLGVWYHVVGTFNQGDAKLYINGNKANEKTSSVTTLDTTGYDALIGAYRSDSPAQFFNGSIDDVRIYNRALSAEEVKYHYNHGGPVASWNFDEGSGTAVHDSSENGFDGVLHE